MSATWTNEVRMTDAGKTVAEGVYSLVRIGTEPHGLFPGWWLGTWVDADSNVLARTDGAYASHRMALLAAASALANWRAS